eukprot:3286106-Pyramimonas_sp.AAC.1
MGRDAEGLGGGGAQREPHLTSRPLALPLPSHGADVAPRPPTGVHGGPGTPRRDTSVLGRGKLCPSHLRARAPSSSSSSQAVAVMDPEGARWRRAPFPWAVEAVSYTHLRAHETGAYL